VNAEDVQYYSAEERMRISEQMAREAETQPLIKRAQTVQEVLDLGLPESRREDILEQAKEIISTDRNIEYGSPERNFAAIAELWTVYLGHEIKPHDVAVALMLVKVARIRQSPSKTDHWVDLAGYAACGGEVAPKA